ncbi:hypothetical protein [Corynebacterium striatum]|uniref:VG15 protein n=1 Tax=Corynebacterium striatum TaxID=43770 RepID=UPI0034D600BA
MSVDDLNRLARKIDAGVEVLIGEYLAKNGVPQSVQAVSHMAEDLFPEVSRYRRKMYRQQVVEMGKAAAAHGVEVSPAKLDSYDVNALYTALSDAVGLTPKSRAFVQVEFLDEETQKSVRRKVLIRKADAFDPVVVDEVTKRLGARVGRHIRSGARKAVSNTAMVGQARDARTKRPVKMGYARVLSGSENCSFCAMLASRGPVYSEDTVTRRRDGRKYHDHCDCQGVLVFKGYSWEGEEQYRKLEAAWMESDKGDGSAATLARFNQKIAETPGGVQGVLDGAGRLVLNGLRPKSHERVTFERLVRRGHVVEVLPVSTEEKVRTPDILVDGVPTEVKART